MISATKESQHPRDVAINRTPSARAGYVLVQLEPSASKNIARVIEHLETVSSADLITGPYDVIVTPQPGIRAAELREVLAEVPGVLRALACEPNP